MVCRLYLKKFAVLLLLKRKRKKSEKEIAHVPWENVSLQKV